MEVRLAREALLTFCAARANWADLVMQSRWLTDGDRGMKLFYKTFKGMTAAKEIDELLDEVGNVKSSWDDLARISIEFFTNSIGNAPGVSVQPVDPLFLQEVLEIQRDKLSVEEKEVFNAPILLEELGQSVNALANGKCPGPYGTPIEFYKANWTTVGPLVLQSLILGIEEEHFPEFITRGAIVLLRKKEDQHLLSNKRPITLLNSVYKIGAKMM